MQPFVLYNSEQRKKVEFVPRKEGQIFEGDEADTVKQALDLLVDEAKFLT